MKIGRLNIGITKTNEEHRFSVAAWQDKSGYWRWHISWTPRTKGFVLIRPCYIDTANYEPRYYTPGGRDSILRGIFHGHFSCCGIIPLIGGWSFSTQPPALR